MRTLGFVTIGQAPRDDIMPDIRDHLPADVDIVQVGALDKFDSEDAVQEEVGPREGKPIFVTLLRDGTEVTIDREHTIELVQDRIRDIDDQVEAIGMLCTGDFPRFQASVPVLEPRDLLRSWARAVVHDGTIGVMVPKEEQIQQTHAKWEGVDIVTAAATPYGDMDEIVAAARSLENRVDLVVMSCMGYTPEMKDVVRRETAASVLLPRSVLAKTLSELV